MAEIDPDEDVVPLLAREYAPNSVQPRVRNPTGSDSSSSDDDEEGRLAIEDTSDSSDAEEVCY